MLTNLKVVVEVFSMSTINIGNNYQLEKNI